MFMSLDSAVGVVTGSRLADQVVRAQVPVGSRIFYSLHPDWLRGPPSLVSNEYQGLFPLA
jgi:hypothetical protein